MKEILTSFLVDLDTYGPVILPLLVSIFSIGFCVIVLSQMSGLNVRLAELTAKRDSSQADDERGALENECADVRNKIASLRRCGFWFFGVGVVTLVVHVVFKLVFKLGPAPFSVVLFLTAAVFFLFWAAYTSLEKRNGVNAGSE